MLFAYAQRCRSRFRVLYGGHRCVYGIKFIATAITAKRLTENKHEKTMGAKKLSETYSLVYGIYTHRHQCEYKVRITKNPGVCIYGITMIKSRTNK